MPIEIKMPALSPTMEEGTLAKWLVKEGDSVKSGDILAEIETDKATMEYEAVDEGTISQLVVAEGSDGVKVGTVIALLTGEDEGEEDRSAGGTPQPANAPATKPAAKVEAKKEEAPARAEAPKDEQPRPEAPRPAAAPAEAKGDRVKASPLARRIAEQRGVDLAGIKGSGPGGRIVKADLGTGAAGAATVAVAVAASAAGDAPSETIKLSNMRKTIARRLTESKQQVPHIYLTVDVLLDPLLKVRGELNRALEPRNIKLSVNDLLIKAQALALIEVSACNVRFAGDSLIQYKRADISVAVSIPGGLITPIVRGADLKSVSAIATEVKDLATRARDGKLSPEEYQGGTASLSNMGMYGIKQFDAVINPPQAMILAIGAGEKRPYVIDDQLTIATVMSATGSFDHRAIDGADGAAFMAAFKRIVENPLAMLA